MARSTVLIVLLAAALAACSQAEAPLPPTAIAVESLKSAFVPYCGPVWSVGKQGYVLIPCPPGSNYPGGV
jgi:hypothetical protein